MLLFASDFNARTGRTPSCKERMAVSTMPSTPAMWGAISNCFRTTDLAGFPAPSNDDLSSRFALTVLRLGVPQQDRTPKDGDEHQ